MSLMIKMVCFAFLCFAQSVLIGQGDTTTQNSYYVITYNVYFENAYPKHGKVLTKDIDFLSSKFSSLEEFVCLLYEKGGYLFDGSSHELDWYLEEDRSLILDGEFVSQKISLNKESIQRNIVFDRSDSNVSYWIGKIEGKIRSMPVVSKEDMFTEEFQDKSPMSCYTSGVYYLLLDIDEVYPKRIIRKGLRTLIKEK